MLIFCLWATDKVGARVQQRCRYGCWCLRWTVLIAPSNWNVQLPASLWRFNATSVIMIKRRQILDRISFTAWAILDHFNIFCFSLHFIFFSSSVPALPFQANNCISTLTHSNFNENYTRFNPFPWLPTSTQWCAIRVPQVRLLTTNWEPVCLQTEPVIVPLYCDTASTPARDGFYCCGVLYLLSAPNNTTFSSFPRISYPGCPTCSHDIPRLM